ncbi:MAG: oxygen-dependent coproporphyrinogen oxidase [Bacteroidota bacterium]|nr:oxygen-dependent coproporphyrinogen oxidase [Bacteroidota bacterium]
MVDKTEIQDWFITLQDAICEQIQNRDGRAKFIEDKWDRAEGGGGRSRVIVNGNILEKAGVNFSAVWGKTPQNVLKALNLPESDFFATGVSIVMHPSNPMVPIIHMNVRYFEMSNGRYWFGGGIDLTPHYVVKDDAQFFHQQLKKVCDTHNSNYYPKFKNWADDYFYIKHRNETRGIGGIFFDHLSENENVNKIQLWEFVKDVGSIFAPVYGHLMDKNAKLPFNENHKKWQLLRRGRYVEFNLVYDKGTKFGLDTNGRTESILMSMPPEAQWVYNYKVEPNSEEEKTVSLLKKGIEWA